MPRQNSIESLDISESIKALDIRAKAYRNRRIGDFLKELKLTEGRNTGFPTTFAALRDNGSPMPEFEMDNERDYLTVRLPIHTYFLPKVKEKDLIYNAQILSVLDSGPLSLTDISRAMGYKGITSKLKKAVEALCGSGSIEKKASEN